VVWQVVRQNSSDPLEGAIVTLAFNGQPDAEGLVYFSDANGEVHIYLEGQPDMGPDGYGMLSVRREGYQVTSLPFRYVVDQRRLVLVSADEQASLSEQNLIRLYKQANLPRGGPDEAKVIADCFTAECAYQILRTSGYVDPAASISCQDNLLDNSRGSYQTYRASNGFSIDRMVFGPSDPLEGWRCSTKGGQDWFIVYGCGNLAQPYNQKEER
jgi:hypothetical protein